MARKTNDERLKDVHAEALTRFERIQSAVRNERLQCLQDRRFYSISGAQWEGPLQEQFENRPRMEVNKIALAVQRMVSEYRNNRVTVDFVPRDGSNVDDELADVCDRLYRADEQDSSAVEAYDNAFEEAAGGGFGAWRMRTVYEDDEDPDNERQRIKIEPIYDADSSVFFDIDARRQDKADATHAFILTAMDRQSYINEYGDDPASWPKEIYQFEFDWDTPDVVFLAEYFDVEEVSEEVRTYRHLDGEEEKFTARDFRDDEDLEDRLAATGSVEVRRRRVKVRRVHKYLMSGGRILRDDGFIAGKHIPIVPVYGKRWFIDNVERCCGIVRMAKDAQRLKNMQLSKLAEISAYSSIEKPILTPEQVAGHQMMWADDNIKQYPYLLINPVTGPDGSQQISGPVAYTKSAAIPPSLAALLEVTERDMQDILGSPQQADKMVSNISGKAVELIQTRLDTQTFLYMSNYARGMQRGGEIWLSMAVDVYVEPGRRMKSVGSGGEVESVELMKPRINAQTGEMELVNDLSRAKFDVAADVGPSSTSKRAAMVRALTGMMAITQDPETSQVLQALAMMQMEGEGLTEAREFFRRKLVRMGVVKPTEAEAQEMAALLQGQGDDPNAVFLQAAAEEATAKAAQARANTVKTVADAELSRARTVETLSKVELDDQRAAIDTAKGVLEVLRG
jgi:hypothetical protein